MKIQHYRGTSPNFGDELNVWLWPKLVPNYFDEIDSTVFIGIGSIIGEKNFAKHVRKVVFGAGFVPEYHTKPNMADNWDCLFVRGPRTAEALGLPPEKGLGDSAILLRALNDFPEKRANNISFMPHWQSLERGQWAEACALADINLIDPRKPVDQVFNQICQSKMVIAEAMHGAIVADALRVPWLPLMPLNPVHRMKWFDWSESMLLSLQQNRLWPSSLLEARLSILRKPLSNKYMAPVLNKILVHMAATRLHQLAQLEPQLSDDNVIILRTEQMMEKLAILVKNYPSGDKN